MTGMRHGVHPEDPTSCRGVFGAHREGMECSMLQGLRS